jgi:2-phosphoglycolate phosphatase
MPTKLHDYAAILFDFDGTLADSYDAIASSVNHVRAQRGHAPLTTPEVTRYVGRGADYLLMHTIPDCRLTEDLACYREHHPGVMLTLTKFLPGALQLLTMVKRANKKIGLCSNKPRDFSEALLAHLGVADLFDVVLGPEDVASPKPAPDMLLTALARLGLPKERVLYVGDMTVDIQTARGAGVCVWIVATGSDERQPLIDANPDRLLTGLHEMIAEFDAA